MHKELHEPFKLEHNETDTHVGQPKWIEKTIQQIARKLYEKYGATKHSWAHLCRDKDFITKAELEKILKKYCGGKS